MDDEYTKAIDFVEELGPISSNIRQRRILDSAGTWHTITQNNDIFFVFDELIGLTKLLSAEENRLAHIDLKIMDEALAEKQRTGLTLDVCFQTIVLKRNYEKIVTEINTENEK